MAGTILISDNVGLATSTVEFDHLVERIRKAFVVGEEQLASDIYEPMDEGGMTFISVSDKDPEVLVAFGNAVMRAYLASQNEASFPSYKERWLELIGLIKSDPRWTSAE